jgi:hypothetical protein
MIKVEKNMHELRRNLSGIILVIWSSLSAAAEPQIPIPVPDQSEQGVEYLWLNTYQKLLTAQAQEASGEYDNALETYREAEAGFSRLQQQFPSWSPDWIVLRLSQCRDKITKLKNPVLRHSGLPHDQDVEQTLLVKEMGKLVWALAETTYLLTDYYHLKSAYQALVEKNLRLERQLAQFTNNHYLKTHSSPRNHHPESPENIALVKFNQALVDEREKQEILLQEANILKRQLAEITERLKVLSLEKELALTAVSGGEQQINDIRKTISEYQKILTEQTEKNAKLENDNAQKELLIRELQEYINWQNTMLNDLHDDRGLSLTQKIMAQEDEIRRLKLDQQQIEQSRNQIKEDTVMKHLDWDKLQAMNHQLREQIDELVVRLQRAQEDERVAGELLTKNQYINEQLQRQLDELEKKWRSQILINKYLNQALIDRSPSSATK